MEDLSDYANLNKVKENLYVIFEEVNDNWYYIQVKFPKEDVLVSDFSVHVYANVDGSEEPDAETYPYCTDEEWAFLKLTKHDFDTSSVPLRSHIARTFSRAISELEQRQADSEDTVAEIKSAIEGVRETHESVLCDLQK